MIDFVDAMIVVDKECNIIQSIRLNARFGDKLDKVYSSYNGKNYFDVYPSLGTKESGLLKCLRSGRVISRYEETITDMNGNRYRKRVAAFPIIRFGEVVGAMELSEDITSIGDAIGMKKNGFSQKIIDDDANVTRAETLSNSIVTVNLDMIANIKKIKIYTSSDEPVLIFGETGTGKEMFVQAMIDEMPARASKFVAQNCAAIPDNLFESLLFGSTRGAFTGAENKPGLFELADNGILFLDELNSMPMHMQAKLLRVIQDRIIRPVGSATAKSVNTKIIVAVNSHPLELIKANKLRQDLFYRLSSQMLFLSPLRSRKEDIPVYIKYFLAQFNQKYGKIISGTTPDLKKALLRYDWPGNVRELRHVIESMVILAESNILCARDLPIYLKDLISPTIPDNIDVCDGEPIEINRTPLKNLLEETEKEHIIKILDHCKGNVTRAAAILDVPRQTLKFRMNKLGIKIRIDDC